MTAIQYLRLIVLSFLSVNANADSKLIATSGVSQIEGSSGGGLVSWATIAGYGEEGELSPSIYKTDVSTNDFRLSGQGFQLGIHNQYEISLAQQRFNSKSSALEIRQNVVGVKAKLSGDLIYTSLPQISLGLQYKQLLDDDVAELIGVKKSSYDIDYYIAASKVQLSALRGYHILWNATLRATRANQFGLLGFGGRTESGQDDYQLMPEFSLAILPRDNLAIGIESRLKPDLIDGVKEDNARDIFFAYFPNKQFSVTLAYVDVGRIAGSDRQKGIYSSVSGYF